jgi:hypothetical protein
MPRFTTSTPPLKRSSDAGRTEESTVSKRRKSMRLHLFDMMDKQEAENQVPSPATTSAYRKLLNNPDDSPTGTTRTLIRDTLDNQKNTPASCKALVRVLRYE